MQLEFFFLNIKKNRTNKTTRPLHRDECTSIWVFRMKKKTTEEHKKETISDQKPTKIVVTSHTNNTPHITLLLLYSIKKIIHKIAYKNK